MKIYRGEKGRDIYTYDPVTNTVTDKVGNCINMIEPLKETDDEEAVSNMLDLMFKELYKRQNDIALTVKFLREVL